MAKLATRNGAKEIARFERTEIPGLTFLVSLRSDGAVLRRTKGGLINPRWIRWTAAERELAKTSAQALEGRLTTVLGYRRAY